MKTMWKQKRSGLENKIENETKMNYEVGENIDKKMIKRFWKWFLKQSKKKLMATNYQLLH